MVRLEGAGYGKWTMSNYDTDTAQFLSQNTMFERRKEMNKTFLILAIVLGVLSAHADNPYQSVTNVSLPTVIETNTLVGTYYTGDRLGYNLTLNIDVGGEYSCMWRGCLGVYGTATGTWTIATNTLHLSPKMATHMLKDRPLPPLDVLVFQRQYIFVDPTLRGYFLKYGPDRVSVFQKDEARTKRSRATSDSAPGAEPDASER